MKKIIFFSFLLIAISFFSINISKADAFTYSRTPSDFSINYGVTVNISTTWTGSPIGEGAFWANLRIQDNSGFLYTYSPCYEITGDPFHIENDFTLLPINPYKRVEIVFYGSEEDCDFGEGLELVAFSLEDNFPSTDPIFEIVSPETPTTTDTAYLNTDNYIFSRIGELFASGSLLGLFLGTISITLKGRQNKSSI